MLQNFQLDEKTADSNAEGCKRSHPNVFGTLFGHQQLPFYNASPAGNSSLNVSSQALVQKAENFPKMSENRFFTCRSAKSNVCLPPSLRTFSL
jgi:hypothetical protein